MADTFVQKIQTYVSLTCFAKDPVGWSDQKQPAYTRLQ